MNLANLINEQLNTTHTFCVYTENKTGRVDLSCQLATTDYMTAFNRANALGSDTVKSSVYNATTGKTIWSSIA